MAMLVRRSDLTICIRLNFRLQKLNIELKSLRGEATGIAPSQAPNIYAQLNAAVDEALPYEGMAQEVAYIQCMEHLPRRRRESVVQAAVPKRRATPKPSRATSKGATPEARRQWRASIAQAIVGLIIYIYIWTFSQLYMDFGFWIFSQLYILYIDLYMHLAAYIAVCTA